MLAINLHNFARLWLTGLIITSCISCADTKSPELMDFENAASQKIKALATNLKKELSTSMQNGGPVVAVANCKLKAPEITQQLNSDDEIKIRRTSLRVRNPDNAADTWELKVLNTFEEKLSAGTPIQELVYSEELKQDDKTTYRMMRAIPAQALCLTCHGDKQNMSNELIEKLAQDYPNDQATGFSAGDIRGAFSVSQTISH